MKYFLLILLGLTLTVGGTFFEAWLLMLLWNIVLPMIWVGAPVMSFWAAVGILLICNILFRSVIQINRKD